MKYIHNLSIDYCENMIPGSRIPHTEEFKKAWGIRVSFEAGFQAAKQAAIEEYDKEFFSESENFITRLKKLGEW
jgi:hypothetical protein